MEFKNGIKTTSIANGATATTQNALDNSTKLATTAYVDAACAAVSSAATVEPKVSAAVNMYLHSTFGGF